MNRKFSFAFGEYYHIYNRGVEKRDIFCGGQDYERFLRSLYLSNSSRPVVSRLVINQKLSEVNRGDKIVAIGAYCLMPNHIHFLLKEIGDGGISKFMEKLTTSYSKYFNKKYDRVGSLFQGTFKAEHVNRDEYLKYLFAYIHLNPVNLIDPKWREKGISDVEKTKHYLANYRYSSYQDHLDIQREESLTLTRESFPEYFASPHTFEYFIEDWLTFKPE